MSEPADKHTHGWVGRVQGLGIAFAVAAYLVSAVWVGRHSSAIRLVDPSVRQLTIAHFQLEDGYREGLQEIIDSYVAIKAKEGIKVRITQSPIPGRAYQQWFTTQMVAGDPADVIETFTSAAAAEYAAPLNEYVGKRNPYNEGSPIADLSWGDSLMGFERNMRSGSYVWVYTSAGLSRLFANMDLLEKATGERRLPQTFSEWTNMCAQVDAYAETVQKPYVALAVDGLNKSTIRFLFERYYQTINQEVALDLSYDGYNQSGTGFDFSYATGRMKPIEDSIWASAEIVCALGRYFPEGFTAIDSETAQSLFTQGRAAFILLGTQSGLGLIRNAPFEVGVGHVPEIDPATPWYRYYDGPLSEIGAGLFGAYMIPKQSRNLDIAIDFLLFMTSYEMNQVLNASCQFTPLVREARYDGLPDSFRPRLEGNTWGFSAIGYGTLSRKVMEGLEDLILNPVEKRPGGGVRARNVTETMAAVLHDAFYTYEVPQAEENLKNRARVRLFGQENARAKAVCLQFKPNATEAEAARGRVLRKVLFEEKGNGLTDFQIRDTLKAVAEQGQEGGEE